MIQRFREQVLMPSLARFLPDATASGADAGFLEPWLEKMEGTGAQSPARVSTTEIFWSWLGSFLGIGLLGGMHQFLFTPLDQVMLIGSFGASAVLVYAAITSPLAQPRNLVGGHVISGIVGMAVWQLAGSVPWLAAALAVSLAIAAMHWTRTLHPPGGATALIAVIGSDQIHGLGFLYPLFPAGLGALLLLAVALLVNNFAPNRRYPLYWW